MSKKSEAAAHAAAPTSIVPADNAWAQRFVLEARRTAAASGEATFEPTALVGATRLLVTLPTAAPGLAASLAVGEFDFTLIAGLGWIGESLSAAVQPTPADRRRTPLLTTAQKATVADDARRLKKDLEAVHSVARATGRLDEARALGLAGAVGRSPGSVYAAYRTFLAQAGEHLALLDDAGVTAAKRRKRAAALAGLEAVTTAKVLSSQKKGSIGRGILEWTLAAECGFAFYRARVMSALEEDPESLPAGLGFIPRAPERRKGPPAGDGSDEIEEDEADEREPGEGTGAPALGGKEEKEEKKADEPAGKAAAEKKAEQPV